LTRLAADVVGTGKDWERRLAAEVFAIATCSRSLEVAQEKLPRHRLLSVVVWKALLMAQSMGTVEGFARVVVGPDLDLAGQVSVGDSDNACH